VDYVALPKIHVKKGDKVLILSGTDKGKTGQVLQVLPRSGKIIVEGVSIVKKHMRPTRDNPQGGIFDKEAPISSSKAMLICPRCNKPTRVGHKFLADGQKVRYCKNEKCGEVIEK
jgi:large subunit ribosomal protein L24